MAVILFALSVAAAAVECCAALDAHTPGPETIPSTFESIFSYSAAVDSTNFSWAAQSWTGENGYVGGNGEPGWKYFTFRMDVYLSGSPLAQSTGAVWPSMTAENIQWKTNGTVFDGVFWGTGSSTFCSVGSLPTLGRAWDGTQFAWLTQEPDVVFVANETISTQYATDVLAAHYSSAYTCQDIWLVLSDGLEPGDIISAPVLYTKADVKEGTINECDPGRTYRWEYAEFSELSTFEAAQSSPDFLLPEQCFNGSHTPSCPAPEPIADALTLWLSIGCVLSSLAGMVGTVLWYRIGLRWSSLSPSGMPVSRALGAPQAGQQGVYQKLVDLI